MLIICDFSQPLPILIIFDHAEICDAMKYTAIFDSVNVLLLPNLFDFYISDYSNTARNYTNPVLIQCSFLPRNSKCEPAHFLITQKQTYRVFPRQVTGLIAKEEVAAAGFATAPQV